MKEDGSAAADQRVDTNLLLSAFLKIRTHLIRVVGRIVQAHHVEDVIQETFLRSFEATSKVDVRHPRAFMTRIAVNIALNHAVRADNKPGNRVDEELESSIAYSTQPLEDQFELEERFSTFCQALKRLPAQCRQAFLLKKVYGLSRKEVAQYLGISESTAQKHIAKGTLMCAEYMEERYPRNGKTRRCRTSAKVQRAGADLREKGR